MAEEQRELKKNGSWSGDRQVIGARGLVDIEDRPGHVALGLVAAVDHGLGLALVQAPLPGKPVEFKAGVLPEMATGSISHDGSSGPLFIDGSLVGFDLADARNN